MAEAKNSATTKPPASVSKRKFGAAKKTKKVKTKLTKAATATVEKVEVKQKEKTERVMTARHQRMVEKAKVRSSMPAPEAIPEVAAVKITDVSGVVYDIADYQSMVDMYDSTIRSIREGEVVSGTVMGVTRDDVIVDVGFKSEGIIPIDEFPAPLNIKVGDEIEVFLEQIEDSFGQLILSKQKADFMRIWDKIREVHDAGEQIEGRVMRRIKGGLVVDIMGVDAFLPGSQVALRQVPDFDALINQMMSVKIIKINKTRRNIVISRRVVLEEQRESMRSSLLSEIAVGQIRQGVVKNITDFGVFIDLGGVDGLLHITDMSWGRIRHPSEMVNLSAKIDVKILDFDEKTSRISLGLKQMTPYPWENIEQKYPLGKKVTGRVVSITDFGAFVELEKGVEGLIHISEMSWTQHIKHPSKILNVNDQVEAVILSVDKENEKLSLGIKQMEPDPWGTIEEKFPVNKVVSGKVRNLTAFGAFVELEEGIDGLVHISDMSWTKRIQHPSEIMKKSDQVEIKILKIDHDNRRISLGFKQLTEDPWPEISRKYAVGTDCLGNIAKVLDRGIVVDLDGDLEGFVPMAQLGHRDLDQADTGFTEGESIPLQVIELDKNQRKVVLSVVAYYKKREQSEYDEFLAKHQPKGTAMGDAMPDELKATVPEPAAETTPAETETVDPTADTAPETEAAKAPAEAEAAVEEAPAVEAATEEAAAETTDAPSDAAAASTDDTSEEDTPKE
ncbi:MAG: 30S ribosomal protein S1 [candidate division Zixibacteria bacterium]|nr:30S ribosomal protein S1 [candidate division Zixibacteria bacterium]MDH4033115.1 30S ribosomal protein S1 [candidate division Zixibacteria bacterium]